MPSGVGAFFNVMNFGQMLMWHIVLIPVVLVAMVGAHVLAVRVRGVAHPLPVGAARAGRRAAAAAASGRMAGPTRRYDILKEATVATWSPPSWSLPWPACCPPPTIPPVTIATWAKVAPADFVATAASELAGTSETAIYGPPYNSARGSTQSLLFSPANHHRCAPAHRRGADFVLSPLEKIAPTDPALAAALHRYNSASPAEQAVEHGVRQGSDQGPIPRRRCRRARGRRRANPGADRQRVALARSGALDSDLISNQAFYGTNFTKPLLFLEDGQYFANQQPRTT